MSLEDHVFLTVMASFGLEKLARARWKKELGARNLGLRDLARLGMEAKGGSGVRAVNRGLQAQGPDFSPEQAVRHGRLLELQEKAIGKAEGIIPKNTPGRGPTTFMIPDFFTSTGVKPQINIGPHSGTALRLLGSSNPIMKTIGTAGLVMPEVPSSLHRLFEHPEDKSLLHGIQAHELAEAAMGRGNAAGTYQAAPIASHFGGAANVAERFSTFRDPEAGKVLDRLRSSNPEDLFIERKKKQFGATPNLPLPLGGRPHRKLEDIIAARAPGSHMSIQNRVALKIPLSDPVRKPWLKRLAQGEGLWARFGKYVPSSVVKKYEDSVLPKGMEIFREALGRERAVIKDPRMIQQKAQQMLAALSGLRHHS